MRGNDEKESNEPLRCLPTLGVGDGGAEWTGVAMFTWICGVDIYYRAYKKTMSFKE